VNLPAAVSLSGERGCAGDPIAACTPEGAVDGEMERSADDGIRFVRPPQLRRRGLLCPGMMVETITIAGREHFDSGYCGPMHLLIAHEQLSRRRGVTCIEGLPNSKRENLAQTLTFVPPGHQFREWHDPDNTAHITYIYIDPSATALTAGRDIDAQPLLPRLHFHSSVLWQTVLKVKTLVEGEGVRSAHYGNALGVVLTHELAHNAHGVRDREGLDRGGLAAWQRRLVAQHVEEHLAERLPISRLAKLARLSRYHFCRSFRHSFGESPHRYHLHRRAERAKTLLANPALSVTDIALDLGFLDTSSFSTAFRKLVGRTPTGYRRSLAPSKA
jgi:AraC family transcriptional regulator